MPNLHIPHLILTVKNFAESRDFYFKLYVEFLKCSIKADEEDFFYFSINETDDTSLGISAENAEFKSDNFSRYRVGLHHFAVELQSRELVNQTFELVQKLGARILDQPQLLPEYGDNYYAFYYLDPSGMKHEFVAFEEI
ncbi:MAG: hypothetical protein OHK0017_13340 [Patescibacteria group bacterium]